MWAAGYMGLGCEFPGLAVKGLGYISFRASRVHYRALRILCGLRGFVKGSGFI